MDEVETATVPRENLISKAVEFLQHPKVQSSSVAQRKAFLTKKGLTESEVDLAIQRSGVRDLPESQTAPPTAPMPGNAVATLQPAAPGTLWSRARDITFVCVIVGGVSYSLYQLIKRYVLPIWLGPSQEEKEIQILKKGMADLEKNIQVLVDGMKKMQETVTKQEDNVRLMVQNSAHSRGTDALQQMKESGGFKEIKSEITSLKGLLLSRNQFPKTPRPQPVIPSWQLASSPDSEEGGNESTIGNKVVTVAEINTMASNGETDQEVKGGGTGTEVKTAEVVSGDSVQCNGVSGHDSEEAPTKKSSSFELINDSDTPDVDSSQRHVSFAPSSTDAADVADES